MKISLQWLKEFVEVPVTPKELKADLTRIGLNTEIATEHEGDWVFDVEVTTNRPDCLSHYGVAREVATLYRKPLKKLEAVVKDSAAPATGEISIEVAAPDLCARYCGRVLQNIQVKPSPDWLRKRLEAVGQRSINNVADATNYVLMELGHPLHAFDLGRIRHRKIIVRRAKAGEPLRTLDGVDRMLNPENLVIADGIRPLALAGIMGGEDSEITSGTRALLLESAWFEPLSIRRTSKAQGLHTEASHRFERGADIEMVALALDRTASRISQLAGGEILRGVVDIFPRRALREDLVLRRGEILRILGTEVSWEEVERILRALGFHTERRGTEGWRVTTPSFRLDTTREVDLIEEVARHYGYDRLPSRLRPAPPRVEHDLQREKQLATSDLLVGLGYHEIICSSMIDPGENARFTGVPPVVLTNPLSQDASALRSSPIPNMVRALKWNLDRDERDIRLFESGKIYWMNPAGQPEEKPILTLGISGNRVKESVHEKSRPVDFYDLKGDLETLLEAFEIPVKSFVAGDAAFLESGLAARWFNGGEALAVWGQLSQELAREYKLRQPVYVGYVDYEHLLGYPLRRRKFRAFSRYPRVERDFALVVPNDVTYEHIASALQALNHDVLEDFRPMDHFRGAAVAAGYYALLLRIALQSSAHTLTGGEINEASDQVMNALKSLGIKLRTASEPS